MKTAPNPTAFETAPDKANHTPIASRIKAAIVALAVWGLIPAGLATWLLRRLHLGAE